MTSQKATIYAINAFLFLFVLIILVLMALSLYGIIHYGGKGKDEPNAKLFVGLSATYIAFFIFFSIVGVYLLNRKERQGVKEF